MARPTKQGIDYFPLDVAFDEKTEMYLVEKGAVGLAVLVTTWQLIYSGEGYYIEDTPDLRLRIKRRIDLELDVISDCLVCCVRRNIFDKSMHERKNILTSKALQTRFFDAARRKKKVVALQEFLLVDVSAYINLVNVDINPVNVDINATKEKGKGKGEVNVNNNSRRQPIEAAFKPDDADYRILLSKKIPRYFIDEQVPEFVAFWTEQKIARDDFHARFRRRVIELWNEPKRTAHANSPTGDSQDFSDVETTAGFLRTLQ